MPDDRLTITSARDFRDRIAQLSGEKIMACYQCGECTAGCPVSFAADRSPNQVIRLVQLNQEQPALRNSMIWLCVGCETCAQRCPRGVDLAHVMDALREIAMARGVTQAQPEVAAFHRSFLNAVQRDGRLHELGMVAEYKLRSRAFLDDIPLGVRMFLKGKLELLPGRVRSLTAVRRLFSECRASETSSPDR